MTNQKEKLPCKLNEIPFKKIFYTLLEAKTNELKKEMLIDIRKLLIEYDFPEPMWYSYLYGYTTGLMEI